MVSAAGGLSPGDHRHPGRGHRGAELVPRIMDVEAYAMERAFSRSGTSWT